ncbi:MFS sugar transporter, partial [Arthrobacter sp. SIMBA_036]
VVLLANIFAYTGTFILFTYLSPIREKITGFSLDTINIILLIFGIGVALGNMTGGRISNRNPSKTLVYLFTFHAVMLFMITFVLM